MLLILIESSSTVAAAEQCSLHTRRLARPRQLAAGWPVEGNPHRQQQFCRLYLLLPIRLPGLPSFLLRRVEPRAVEEEGACAARTREAMLMDGAMW